MDLRASSIHDVHEGHEAFLVREGHGEVFRVVLFPAAIPFHLLLFTRLRLAIIQNELVDQQNVAVLPHLEDELDDAPMPDAGPALPESRRRRMSRRQRRIAESRRGRKASTSTQRQLNEYKKAAHALKAQLTEMNLFNAKLLYANKLMQNRNLNQKQQRAIVEALDNAKTLREAKLLYQSLTKSLNKVPRKNLNEGSLRTLGSSSKSTRSGAPASSGVEVDRWATLAGLYKD